MEAPDLEVDLTSVGASPAAEAEHLRRLLDKQPSCLMRVGADGELLAANDASLRLLGVESLGDALGKPINRWLPPDQHTHWAAFSAQVVGGSPSSIECDIHTAAGERRVARFHGISLSDHPDGVASMVLSARDAMDRRRLERSLNEMAADRERILAESEAERAKVREGLEALRAQYLGELQRAAREAAQRQAEALREEHDAVLRGLESQRLDLQAQLDHAFADRDRVQSALAAAEVRLQQTAVEREADRSRFERSLDSMVERHESELREAGAAIGQLTAEKTALQQKLDHAEGQSLELTAALRDAELARAELQTRLDEAVADCRRLEDAALRQAEASREDHDAVLRALESERLDFQARLDQAIADRERVESALAEARLQHLAAVRHESDLREAKTAIERLTAEQSALQQKLDHAEGHGLELAVALRDAEARRQQDAEALARDTDLARAELQARLHEAVTDCRRLEEAVLHQAGVSREEHDAALRRLESERFDLQNRLDQAIVDRERVESALAGAEARLLCLASERSESDPREAGTAIEQVTAEASVLRQKLDRAENRGLELAAALGDAELARSTLQARLDEAVTDCRRLEEAVTRQAGVSRAEHNAALRALESERLDFQARLDQAIADRGRVESALAEAEARLQRLAGERHESDLREAADAVNQAAAEQNAVESGAADAVREREQFWTAIEQAGTAIGQLTAEKDALQQKLDQAEGHRVELAAALRDVEGRHQQAVDALARDAELARSALQSRLDEAVMDCRRLEAALLARNAASAQAPGETVTAGAPAAQGALATTAADQAIALHALADQVRRLSPLAAAGRVGREIAAELQCLVRGADAASTRLLAACPIDHPHRADVERLRADSIQAAALAGELLLATGGPDDSGRTPRRTEPQGRCV
jgi:PAS domain S-box-containing protein